MPIPNFKRSINLRCTSTVESRQKYDSYRANRLLLKVPILTEFNFIGCCRLFFRNVFPVFNLFILKKEDSGLRSSYSRLESIPFDTRNQDCRFVWAHCSPQFQLLNGIKSFEHFFAGGLRLEDLHYFGRNCAAEFGAEFSTPREPPDLTLTGLSHKTAGRCASADVGGVDDESEASGVQCNRLAGAGGSPEFLVSEVSDVAAASPDSDRSVCSRKESQFRESTLHQQSPGTFTEKP